MVVAGVVYRITCTTTGLSYVGVTREKNPARRFQKHCAEAMLGRGHYLAKAIKKHGPGDFTFQVIYEAFSLEAMYAAENQLVVDLGTKRPCGYNLADGGRGPLGVSHGTETRARMSAAKKGWTPPPRSPATRELIAASKRGKPLSAEHRAVLSAKKMGVKRSEESKAKQAATMRANQSYKRLRRCAVVGQMDLGI
jgi:group I intron endonuclease